MRGLAMFNHFDFYGFVKDKKLIVCDISEWVDYNDKSIVKGTKITTVIYEDHTDYGESEITNKFEKIVAKIPKKVTNTKVKIDDFVVFKNAVARVYGDYNNLLSVVAEDVSVVD